MTRTKYGKPRFTWSIGGDGSGGLGIGLWRCRVSAFTIIWTLALGPFTFYMARDKQ